jgi:hypothetical protein
MCFSKLKKKKKRKKGGVTDIPIEMKITDVHNWGAHIRGNHTFL